MLNQFWTLKKSNEIPAKVRRDLMYQKTCIFTLFVKMTVVKVTNSGVVAMFAEFTERSKCIIYTLSRKLWEMSRVQIDHDKEG